MKCKNCGAEIDSNSRTCKFCGSQITMDMLKEQETLNKQGCPKCGSTNITFRRENQGEVRGKNYKQVVHRTVGYCKDCGETWYPSSESEMPNKRKTWLWVLGWIFIFPVPLTILMLRKKDMKPAVKYGIIAVAWIIYLIIGFSGNSSDTNNNKNKVGSNSSTVSSSDITSSIIQDSAVSDLDIIYKDDEDINLYINRFNESNPDYKITSDLAQKYYHHGREHDDQIKFSRDDFDVSLSSGYKFKIVIQGKGKKTNKDYKKLFYQYARGFKPSITDETLNDYWKQLLDDTTNNVKFNEFECDLSILDEKIQSMVIEGKLN